MSPWLYRLSGVSCHERPQPHLSEATSPWAPHIPHPSLHTLQQNGLQQPRSSAPAPEAHSVCPPFPGTFGALTTGAGSGGLCAGAQPASRGHCLRLRPSPLRPPEPGPVCPLPALARSPTPRCLQSRLRASSLGCYGSLLGQAWGSPARTLPSAALSSLAPASLPNLEPRGHCPTGLALPLSKSPRELPLSCSLGLSSRHVAAAHHHPLLVGPPLLMVDCPSLTLRARL